MGLNMTKSKKPEVREQSIVKYQNTVNEETAEGSTSLETIQTLLSNMQGIGYAEDDVIAFLQFNGDNMLAHLTESICNKLASGYTRHKVPPKAAYLPLRLKAIETFIPIGERWLKRLKSQRKQIAKEISEQTI